MVSRQPMNARIPAELERGNHPQGVSRKSRPVCCCCCCCCCAGYATCLAIAIALLTPVVLLSSVGVLRSSRKAGQARHLLQVVGSGNLCRKAHAAASALCCVVDTRAGDALNVGASSPLPLEVAVLLFRQLARSDRVVFGEILKGAHVSIPDPDHVVYSFLAHLPKPGGPGPAAYLRPSSHRSNAPQMGLDLGTLMVTMLIGTDGGNTWLQLEGDAFNPVGGEVWNSIFHGLDFLMYRVTGKNVGPMRLSIHTDRNPLVCHLAHAAEACPNWC